MPLFETLPVERDAVASLVLAHWGLQLDGVLKASQNTTFAAHDAESGAKYAVRVTPDAADAHRQRIADELTFVAFLASHAGLDGVCAPVPPRAGGDAAAPLVRAGDLTLVVFQWAAGEPLDFLGMRWATDGALVRAWGAWLARLHAASRAFAAARPDVAARVRRWDELHESILAGAPLHDDDAAAAATGGPSAAFGVLHGDLNLSNFFVGGPADAPTLSVFDWDQTQLGWWEWDVAQAALTSLMLQEAGMVGTGAPVPQADHARALAWLVEGYERVAGAGALDAPRLARMVALRKAFYGRFGARAKAEGVPPGMAGFIDYIDAWVNGAAGGGGGTDGAAAAK
jgi:Ser/Thr protein kinase RdoA (MazF antagonist)